LERIDHPAATAAGVALYCKRDDLYTLAPGTALQGNKVRKLYPDLTAALTAARPPVFYTFGGAYSNHIAAVAAAASVFHIRALAFIRGEEVDNPLLQDAARRGLRLVKISRSEYRQRDDLRWLDEKHKLIANEYRLPMEAVRCIPEGGTTREGMISAGGAYAETRTQLGAAPDYFCLSAGTGGTAAGIIHAADERTKIEVFPALKGDWMAGEIEKCLSPAAAKQWACISGYDFGGYGKFPAAWCSPSTGLTKRADIGEPGLPPLEPIYTAKLFYGVLDRIRQGVYPEGSRVVILHTGGIY
jgi:1-aminocyclopropane-1-carboxylate deaminase